MADQQSIGPTGVPPPLAVSPSPSSLSGLVGALARRSSHPLVTELRRADKPITGERLEKLIGVASQPELKALVDEVVNELVNFDECRRQDTLTPLVNIGVAALRVIARLKADPDLARFARVIDECLTSRIDGGAMLLHGAAQAEQIIVAGTLSARGYYLPEQLIQLAKVTALLSVRAAFSERFADVPPPPQEVSNLVLGRVPVAAFPVVAAMVGESDSTQVRALASGVPSQARSELLIALANLLRRSPDALAARRLGTFIGAVKSAAQLSPTDACRSRDSMLQLLTSVDSSGVSLVSLVDQEEITEWQRVDDDPKRHARTALHRLIAESLLEAAAALHDQRKGEAASSDASTLSPLLSPPILHGVQEVLHPAVRSAQSLLQPMVREARTEPATKLREAIARCSTEERLYLAAKWLQQSEKSHLRIAREPLSAAMAMLIAVDPETHPLFLAAAGKALTGPKDPHSVLHRVDLVRQQLQSPSPSAGAEALLTFHSARCRAFTEMVWGICGLTSSDQIRSECAERLRLVGRHEVTQSFGRLRAVFSPEAERPTEVDQALSPFERCLAALRFAHCLSSATTIEERHRAEAGLLRVLDKAPWHPSYGAVLEPVLQSVIAAGLRDLSASEVERKTLSVRGALALVQTVAVWPLPSTEPYYDLCFEALRCQSSADQSSIARTVSHLAGRASVARNIHLYDLLRTSPEELRSAVGVAEIEARIARAFRERRTPLAEREAGTYLRPTLPARNGELRQAAFALLTRLLEGASLDTIRLVLAEAGLSTSNPALFFTHPDAERRFPLAAYSTLRRFFVECSRATQSDDLVAVAEGLHTLKKGVLFTQLAMRQSDARARFVLTDWAPQLDEQALRFVVSMSDVLPQEQALRLLTAAFPNDPRCAGRDRMGVEAMVMERADRVRAALALGEVGRMEPNVTVVEVLAPSVVSPRARMALLTLAHQWRRSLPQGHELPQALLRLEAGILSSKFPSA